MTAFGEVADVADARLFAHGQVSAKMLNLAMQELRSTLPMKLLRRRRYRYE